MAVLKALLENITYASLDQNDEFLEMMGARWRRSLWIRIWKHSGQVIFIGSWNQVDNLFIYTWLFNSKTYNFKYIIYIY